MKIKKAKRRFLIYFIAIIIILSYLFVITYNYWNQILSNYEETAKLNQEYEELLAEEDSLTGEVIKLQDDEYVLKYVREKYMYSKEGEYIIKIAE